MDKKLGLVGENEVSCQHGSLWNLLLDGKWPDLELLTNNCDCDGRLKLPAPPHPELVPRVGGKLPTWQPVELVVGWKMAGS